MRKKLILSIVFLFFFQLGALLMPAKLPKITPYNVISFFYNKMKNLNFKYLLNYAAGKENKRIRKIIKTMKKSWRNYKNVQKRTKLIKGFKVFKREVYKKIALVTFAWKSEILVPYKYNKRLKYKKIILSHYNTLMRKVDGLWFVFDTKPVKLTKKNRT